MNDRNIPLFKVKMNPSAVASVGDVLMSGYIGQGPKVDEFEKRLSEFFKYSYVSSLNSATSGIHLALHMARDDHRDEVLTTPLTCTATNFPIVANGYKIKWVDLDPSNCNLCLTDLRRKISPKTLAIMVVHWSGYPVDLDELNSIVDQCESMYGHRPLIIEDCAHALGSTYKGKKIGTHGNCCIFSFQAIKHLTTGDGGAMLSPDLNWHKRVRLLRWYGLDRTSSFDFRCEQNIPEWGFKFHMNDISAAIGLSNFVDLEDTLQRHKDNARFYNEVLRDVPGIQLLENSDDRESASWIFTLRAASRDDFMRRMKERGIAVGRVHDRNDKHDCLWEHRAPLPMTDLVCSEMCCIPCGWWLTPEDREYIASTIKEGW